MRTFVKMWFVLLILCMLVFTAYAQVELIVNSSTDDTVGDFLVAPNGKTLYTFTVDEPGVSNCTGECVSVWPPFVVTPGITPVGGAGVEGAFGTISRDDGSLQVTYNNLPLYTFSGDDEAGDINGQGLNDVWFVASATGAVVAEAPAETVTTDEPVQAEPATTETDAQLPAVMLTISSNPTLGNILTDGGGNTLYIFLNDLPNQSECVGRCVDLWPPLLTDPNVAPVANSDIDGTVGTIERVDGW